jgi:hypothetical protein
MRTKKNIYMREGMQWSNLDVAPTIASLLGIPVPRQASIILVSYFDIAKSEGSIIDDAVVLLNQSNLLNHYRDIFLQVTCKKTLELLLTLFS